MAGRMSRGIEITRERTIRTDGRKMFNDVGFEGIKGT